MKLKTFRAPSMAQALALVKQDLGNEAMVLHTRTFKHGGVLGFGAKTVVEITATDEDRSPRQRKRTPPIVETAKTRSSAARRPNPNESAGDLIRRTYAAAALELSRQQPAVASTGAVGATGSAKPTDATAAMVGCVPDAQLADELRSVKRMVKQLMHRQRRSSSTFGEGGATGGELPEKLFEHYLHLLEQEVAEELVDRVIQQVHLKLKPDDLDNASVVRQAVVQEVAKLIPADDHVETARPRDDRRPYTIALIGPTGVGKTTTIAKLSADFKFKQKKRVGLITLDTYRIAAVDQLRTYANIIGVPMGVVMSHDELNEAIRQCTDCDVVLIDTAGRSQRDDPRLEQLKAFVQAADPHEVHLVLSSTCSQKVMLETVQRFSSIRTDRIIFTKLDEAVSFGVMLNVATQVNKRLSYITTGQEVPHQFEPSRPTRLAALMLGEKL